MAENTNQPGFKGPQLGHRTSRSIAIEKGTDPAGFKDDVPYNATVGHPLGKEYPAGEYKEPTMKAPAGGKPVDITAPFSLGSK